MKKCILSFFVFFLIFITLSCNEDGLNYENYPRQEGNEFFKNEIRLLYDTENVSIPLASFGINSFSKVKTTSKNEEFKINAMPTKVNTVLFDLMDTDVKILKTGQREYIINMKNGFVKGVSLYVNESNKMIRYTHLSKTVDITDQSYKILSTEDKTYFILLYSLLAEAIIGGGERVVPSIVNNRVQKLYYGYTTGFGVTQEEAIHRESTIRNSPESVHDIQQNFCWYLGTTTSCVWGGFGCVTTSTFYCGSNDA
ncbi:hypothetical protein [Dyadobacter arcticus]|uniref:Lipoprotein n=1 Tax=Dyadobacter arcticus TaxID=1078754 RepID=A0ABX0URK6_9BACT|nr:hypothetical protein [Dyadobacter arcticus]NIJ55623.1 hypothetical protein [Dyadobacter arcticus]